MLKIGVIIISISVNKCCNHDKIAISPIFKMAAAAILDFEKKAIVGAWHHPDLISRGSEDSKTVLTSNTCFFKGVKVKIATIPPDYKGKGGSLYKGKCVNNKCSCKSNGAACSTKCHPGKV